jgi:TRAP transporter TAXI family solute receptor
MKKTIKLSAFLCAVFAASIGNLSLIAPSAAQDNAGSIIIGTASPGGPYLAYGQGLSRILSRELKREITAQATQGPAQNIVLLERKELTLAFVTMGVGLQAWNGTDWAKGTKYRSMRILFPMYDTAFQFVAVKRLGTHWLDDFSGLRIGVGPKAGTGGAYVPAVFKALGINVDVRYGAMESMGAQLSSGDLDGAVFATGFPVPALSALAAEHPVTFIQPSPEQVATIRREMPEISPSVVPAATYANQPETYKTIGLYNFAVAHKDLPDELAYQIVKAVFENQPELVKAQASAKETMPENISRNSLLPLHPGAARYYREKGIAIPNPNIN